MDNLPIQSAQQTPEQPQTRRIVVPIIATAVIAAAIAGGSVYWWQQRVVMNAEREMAAAFHTLEQQREAAQEQPQTTVSDDSTVHHVPSAAPWVDANFRAVFLEKIAEDRYAVRSMDERNNFRVIAEHNDRYAYLLNTEGVIADYNYDQNHFVTMDIAGDSDTNGYAILDTMNNDPHNVITHPTEPLIVYSYGAATEQVEGRPVFIKNTETGEETAVEDYTLLPNKLDSSRVIGWSGDLESFYVTKIGWEGYTNAGLWKIALDTKEIRTIKHLDDVPLGALSVVPAIDKAAAVGATETSCSNCLGGVTAGAPAELRIYDLKQNRFTTILVSPDTMLSYPLLAPSGDVVFYQKDGDTYAITSDGSNNRRIAEEATVVAMSRTGDRVIVITEDKTFTLINMADDTRTALPLLAIANYDIGGFLQCAYPLGVSCLYY